MVTMQEQKFGVEIELAGVPRRRIADAVAEGTGGRVTATHRSGYDATIVTDQQEREWKILNDTSIPMINGYKGSEIVTPVLNYADIKLLQNVIRKVKATGAKAHKKCACHVHVSADKHTPQSLSNLAKMFYKNEDLIFDALQVYPERRNSYCRPTDFDFIQKIAKQRPRNDRQLNEAWFGRYTPHPAHYNSTRYHALNLVNKWREINTLEVRVFNSTLHSGKVKAYVQLCLLLSAKALNARSASHRKIQTDNPKFNFRVWLVSTLGMKGEEFKTARYHLTRYLPGNSAWRHGPPTSTGTTS
jgi:hypothetical protein